MKKINVIPKDLQILEDEYQRRKQEKEANRLDNEFYDLRELYEKTDHLTK